MFSCLYIRAVDSLRYGIYKLKHGKCGNVECYFFFYYFNSWLFCRTSVSTLHVVAGKVPSFKGDYVTRRGCNVAEYLTETRAV